MDKGRALLGFGIAFIGYVFLLSGIWQWVLIITVGLFSILALLLLLKDKLPRRMEEYLDSISNGLDISWLLLALALFGVGIAFIHNSFGSLPLLLLGAVFLFCSSLCIGRSIGLGLRDIILSKPMAVIIIGIVFLGLCVVISVINWNPILEQPLENLPQPIFFLGLSIICFYFGLRKLLSNN